ncbi:palmitoyltransferase ZDHHC11 isoform 3-T3 [Menidia menidia]
MKCFRWRMRRTAPASGSSKNQLVPSKSPRVNGWSWPPQALQVAGWLVFTFLGVVSFGIHIPLLPRPWMQVAYAVSSPQQKAVCQCHRLSESHHGNKVKHCGVCNKCVENFDHHCKWLNTCVGGRNYWFFFIALVSATMGVLLLNVVILFIFVQHYLDPHSLRTAPQFNTALGNTTWLVFLPLAPMKTSSAGLLVLAFFTVILSTICLLLLTHLLAFHLYLFYKGMSTFDYVKLRRQKEAKSCDIEAEKSHVQSETPQKLEGSIDCEPESKRSSSCKFDNKDQFNFGFSESICSELDNLNKLAEKDNSVHYGTENPTEKETREMSLSVIKSCNSEDEGLPSASGNSVPEVQNPLGSSVMLQDSN